MSKVLILDTELTDRKEGEIIDAAWLVLKSGGDLFPDSDRIPTNLSFDHLHNSRYRPEKPITHGAMAVHHILPHELTNSPPSSNCHLPEGTTHLVGHSIDTDWEALGSPADVKRICTHAMATHVWPNASGYSQGALIYMILGEIEETRLLVRAAHRAADDVMMNRILLKEILRLHPELVTWTQLWEFSEECRIPITCPLKRWEGVKLADMDDGAISWCLGQSWLSPYFRVGLQRVLAARYPRSREIDDSDDDQDDEDDFRMEALG